MIWIGRCLQQTDKNVYKNGVNKAQTTEKYTKVILNLGENNEKTSNIKGLQNVYIFTAYTMPISA